jgi:hypothetical protein
LDRAMRAGVWPLTQEATNEFPQECYAAREMVSLSRAAAQR